MVGAILKKHAWTNQQKISIGVTYVVADESVPRIVLGDFTLATSAVPRDSLPTKHVRGLPRYALPLILPARLAVDYRFAGKGLGPQLLAEAFRISVAVTEQVGCRCIITDAYRWLRESADTPNVFGNSDSQGNLEELSMVLAAGVVTTWSARPQRPQRSSAVSNAGPFLTAAPFAPPNALRSNRRWSGSVPGCA